MEEVVLYVGEGLLGEIQGSLLLYEEDLRAEGIPIVIVPWSGDAPSLRDDLKKWADGRHSSWFIGDLPFVEYALGGEVFPTDLYFSSPYTSWNDKDGDGIFESHGSLAMTVPVSRLNGTVDEITGYFDKIHRYRAGGLTFEDSVVLFKDDDWSEYRKGSSFGADKLASRVLIVENLPYSTYVRYEDILRGRYKYLYQWIHANPAALYVQEDSAYKPFRTYDIDQDGVDIGFLNLFNCQAARYTQPNLAMTYLTETDTTLAVTGSTKKGGNFEPLEFHRLLSLGRSWSEAFRQWYNKVGVHDDMWYLGMVILGDPALIPGGAEAKGESSDLARLVSPSEEERAYYFNLMSDFTEPTY